MSDAAPPRSASLAGILVVLLFVGFAVAGPVIMVRDRLRADAGAGAGVGGGNVVAVAGLKFQPGTLAVAKGTTVVFVNDDTAPHTVTARSGGTDSGVIDPGKRFALVAASGFDYVCSIHPSMTAKLVVT
ncbi:MAG TPA: plastocyanin/azurin family copper-binding protein [Actinomycetes bacterium]